MSHSTPPRIPLSDNQHAQVPPPYSTVDSHHTTSSLDLTQKLERNLAHLNASDNIFKRWIYEIVSWSVSALCMAAIVAILVYCNNRILTEVSLYLTAISVLSKLASAALILPTSEALGQLKWNWFNGKKSKEIWDFEIFDKASRGPWGSILLLLRTKGQSLAALGAILTVLLLANDTFFQQVVHISERRALRGKGAIAKIVRYQPESLVETRDWVPLFQQEQYVRPTIQEFFFRNGTQPVAMGNGTRPEIPVSCPTSNCTFPEFHTLGVCSRCTDATDILQFSCQSRPLDWIGNLTGLPGKDLFYGLKTYPYGNACGYYVNSTSKSATLMSGYTTEAMRSDVGDSPAGEALLLRMLPLSTPYTRELLWGGALKFKDLRNPIFDALIVGAKDGVAGVYRNETPIAQECALTWCIKQMRSTYHYASLEEEVLSVFHNSTPGGNPWWVDLNFMENSSYIGYFEDINIKLPQESEPYGTSNETHNRILNNFDDIFPSFLTAINETAKPNWRVKAWISDNKFHRLVKRNPWLPPNNITLYMERMATALTNTLRSSSSMEMVEGPAYTIETYVNVQWAWLTFPFILLILSLVFLAATMWKTAKGPGVWKTSAMPTLIYGLPKDTQKELTPQPAERSGASSSLSLKKPKNIRIKLHPERGWRVSGQPLSPHSPVVVLRSNQPPPGWI
ncbi:hypothetical protein DM02DRAFT_220929 [Periconia macrospinosa]|uniref:DUF3176 domain containing protein n=1 Tax=Periconia macrospinosa TaxID=97972 RepID=A0A2V1D6C0_9PLEO|nr:hypothetical protein DM02DRAFT_220929 [Periconia macrospinosa]